MVGITSLTTDAHFTILQAELSQVEMLFDMSLHLPSDPPGVFRKVGDLDSFSFEIDWKADMLSRTMTLTPLVFSCLQASLDQHNVVCAEKLVSLLAISLTNPKLRQRDLSPTLAKARN